jgi:surface polysaccharide O-acyltransferase-like enzyme
MGIFRTNRERALWFWALTVVIAIYSTLGLAGKLAGILREHNILGLLFFFCFLMIVMAIIGSGLQRHAGKKEIWVTVGIMAVYGMVLSRIGSFEERTHLFEYGVVAILINQALTERFEHEKRAWVPAILAVLLTALIGWLDEGIQSLLPNRIYDLIDVGLNFLSALLAVSASLLLRWSRQQISKGRSDRQADKT